ncbi:Uncharacterised protein [Chryseobacterium taklimakanense]|uniref:Uncharacterized protein n=1 Tax=Chryseobacterium taklimakanense TaxID=536441 RepID=A0A239X6N5_9FLAO|nr:hypothetical protein [Chryseobacterium taklimakanense]SNV41654.1 Uncharacterised protein [Chryseobacterium taklimakanense]
MKIYETPFWNLKKSFKFRTENQEPRTKNQEPKNKNRKPSTGTITNNQMKIHLVSTPDVHPQLVDEVLEILNSVSGPMHFSVLKMPWNPDDLFQVQQHRYRNDYRFKIDSEYKKQKYIAQKGYPLSWRELFFLCEKARNFADLEESDFVILVTNRRNSMNFFSMFDTEGKRNAFIQSSDWEIFLEAPESFPVAYEVVANVLRILMKFKLTEDHTDTYHQNPIGCMNDFCENKTEIILKLRTADLCPNCLKRLSDCGTDEEIIVHALNIFERVRSSLKFSQGFVGNIRPKKLKIDEKGNVSVGGKSISLGPLQKTIFIFFLKHLEGIRIAELGDYEQEIFEIYQKLKTNADPKNISNLVNIIDGNFNYNKSRLTKMLRSEIGEPLANYYYITGNPGEKFKIALPSELIEISDVF